MEIRSQRYEETDYRYLNYIIENSIVPSDFAQIIRKQLKYPALLKENAAKLVDMVGLESLEKLTKEFNEIMLKEREEKKTSKKI